MKSRRYSTYGCVRCFAAYNDHKEYKIIKWAALWLAEDKMIKRLAENSHK